MDDNSNKVSIKNKLASMLGRKIETRQDILAQLRSATSRHLIDEDAMAMIEGVFFIADMQVRDVMIPRSHMDVLNLEDSIEDALKFIVETGHSRFPVVSGSKDNIAGTFLAKDLLRYYVSGSFDMSRMLRPAFFVPESKRLNVLLREFRINYMHMAIVVDEYGSVSGLVTIEDVLEEIVGNIEDEYDIEPEETNIRKIKEGQYLVNAITEVEELNDTLDTAFPDDNARTVGGLVIQSLDRLAVHGDTVSINGWRLRVVKADKRTIKALMLEQVEEDEDTPLTSLRD